MSGRRHAVYWVPTRDHALWSAGCDWLGRDPERAVADAAPASITSEPKRYGFHATLMAPTRLVPSATEDEFLTVVAGIASATKRFMMPRLEVRKLADFLALRPVEEPSRRAALCVLEDRIVTELNRFRAAFTAAEWAARISGLDDGAKARTRAWGYHHVFDRWRFHMTLSNSLARNVASSEAAFGEEQRLVAAARDHFAAALAMPLAAEEIAVFSEERPGEPFVLTHRFSLAR